MKSKLLIMKTGVCSKEFKIYIEKRNVREKAKKTIIAAKAGNGICRYYCQHHADYVGIAWTNGKYDSTDNL